MTADVHTLAGAYAVDALPEEERRFFERHLQACDACRREVDELLATAARLGAAAAEAPPAHLRARVLAAAAQTRQLPPIVQDVQAGPSGGWDRLRALARVPAAAAAALVLIAVLVGAQLSSRIAELEVELAEAQRRAGAVEQLVAALAEPDATVTSLESSAAARARVVSSAPDGPAVLLVDGLAPPGPDLTYQLWVLRDGAALPDQVFRPDPEGHAVVALGRPLAAGDAVAVSIEPDAGSAQPTGEIVLQGAAGV